MPNSRTLFARLLVFAFCLAAPVTLDAQGIKIRPNQPATQQFSRQIPPKTAKTIFTVPEALRIFWDYLRQLRENPSTRTLPSLKNYASCREDPFRNAYRYATSTLRNEKDSARGFALKHEAGLGCINRTGMGAWDRMFAAYYRDICARSPDVSRKGIRATMNASLMVADYLLYTGYSETQRAIHDNLSCFQNALRDDSNETFFCRHLDGSVLEFRSQQIGYRAVTTVANEEGQLGFGNCLLCEHAHYNFTGMCGDVSERLACLLGAKAAQGGAVGNEQGASANQSTQGGNSSNDSLRSGMGQQMAEQERDYLNGMTEGELRALACGFGNIGQSVGGMLGGGTTIPPSGRCFSSVAGALGAYDLNKNSAVGNDPLGKCVTRDVFRRGTMEAVRFPPEEQRMMRDSCQWSDIGGAFGLGMKRETVSYDYTWRGRAGGQDVQFDSRVTIDGDGNFNYTLTAHTKDSVVDTYAALNDGELVPISPIGSASMEPAVRGRLNGADRDLAMWRIEDTMSHEGGGGGTVTRCTADTDECRAANAQADAVEDEVRRRQAAERERQGQTSGTPKAPGNSGNPGSEGADRCSAMGRWTEAQVECAQQEEAMKNFEQTGRPGPRGTPPGWQMYPKDEGGSSGFEGLLGSLACGRTSQPASANDDSGAIDPCPPGEPWCLVQQGSGGFHQGEYFRRSQQGVIDPANPSEGGGQGGSSGSGGGCVSSSTPGGRQTDSNCPPRQGPGGDPE